MWEFLAYLRFIIRAIIYTGDQKTINLKTVTKKCEKSFLVKIEVYDSHFTHIADSPSGQGTICAGLE